jgi:hypothetical protein
MRDTARLIHAISTSALVLCVGLQVFLAGMAVFDDPAMFLTHATFGALILLVTIVVLVTATVARAGRRQVGLAALTIALMLLQSIFVSLRAEHPAIAALHPVNGFLIGLIAVSMARAAWRVARATRVEEPGGLRAERAATS